MKIVLVALLALMSVQAQSLEVRIVPNTPLFEDYGCHRYEGNEAVRAALQLIASARLNVSIVSSTFENVAVRSLIMRKSKSVDVRLYSSNPINISGEIATYKVKSSGNVTHMTVDYSYTGIGDIDFAEPMHVRSSFLVCHSSEDNKAATKFEAVIQSGVKIGY